MAAGENRIHRAHQIAEVIRGGDQAGVGQVDLPFTQHMGHLGGEGEAANAHGHHQGNTTGE